MSEWVSVCRIDEMEPGRGRMCEASGLRLALFLWGESVVALSDRCPHEGGSLGSGWIEDDEVVCPLHRWRFKLKDGRCTTMRGNSVHRFPAEIRGNDVWVLV
jgi:NAD(P)H-dependent nitrite reductase small subunit